MAKKAVPKPRTVSDATRIRNAKRRMIARHKRMDRRVSGIRKKVGK